MRTRVFKSGNSLAIRLPKELELPCGEVSIRRDGKRIVIEELSSTGWPEGFFEDILVTRNGFGREAIHYGRLHRCNRPEKEYPGRYQ